MCGGLHVAEHSVLRAGAVDEVALAATPAGGLWLAWSECTFATQTVRLARFANDAWQVYPDWHEAGARAFRPRLGVGAGSLWLGACVRPTGANARYAPTLWRFAADTVGLPEGPYTLAAAGDTFDLTLAVPPGAAAPFVAWETVGPGHSAIGCALSNERGVLETIALPAATPGSARRRPALGADATGLAMAWLEGPPGGLAAVWLARGSAAGFASARPVAPASVAVDAPALAFGANGALAVAWHAPPADTAREGGLTQLRVALGAPSADALAPLHPPPLEPETRAQAGPDQGLEFPALAATLDGTWWLAGRSSNGFHVLARRSGARDWTPRQGLSSDRWGGRGSRAALAPAGPGAVFVAHAEPDGLFVHRVELRAAAGERPSAAASRTPEVGAGAADPASTGPAEALPRLAALPGAAPRAATPRLFFGDLHQHTALSDGLGTPAAAFAAARHVRGHDFAAVTDHDRLAGRVLGPAHWQALCAEAEDSYDPGAFTTFVGYEFTGARLPGPGHRCIYFPTTYPDRLPERDPAAVDAVLCAHGGFAVPHHTGWTGTDWQRHHPQWQPVWEICSLHGVYEHPTWPTAFPPRPDVVLPEQFVRPALDAGLRFGLIGGTDSHGLLWHHGISPRRDPYRTGLAAIYAADCTREALTAGLRARHCYATTGARIGLEVELDGAPMGCELPADARGRLSVRVRGTDRLRAVKLVRRAGQEPLGAPVGALHVASVRVALAAADAWDYLYVRATQSDGEMAWSSPIWLGVAPTAEGGSKAERV